MSDYPEGTRLFVSDMGPVERAYAEAEHETCEDPPKGHPLTAHEPWSGGDLDGVETWETFTARLFRHGLTLTLDPERLRALQAPLSDCEVLRTAVRHLLEAWPNLVNHPSMDPSEIVALRAALAGAVNEKSG